MTLHQSNADESCDDPCEGDNRYDMPSQDHVMQRLRQLQSELMEAARRSAMDAAGAAVAGQLDEPMTALLVHLHAIERVRETPADSEPSQQRMWDSLEKALSEAQRVCDLLDQMRGGGAAPVNTQETLLRGRQAVDGWVRARAYGVDRGLIPSAAPTTRPNSLTTREHEVLAQITGGATNREGGQRLGISTRTFEAHRAHIMRKLGARNAADLVRATLSESR